MEACIAVEKEVDKVVSKLESFEKHQAKTLQELIDTVSSMEQEIGAGAYRCEVYIEKLRQKLSCRSTASQCIPPD